MNHQCIHDQQEVLHSILLNNKALKDELKLQLSVTQNLKDENLCLRKKLNQLQRDAGLWKEREQMCVKKSTFLSVENQGLKSELQSMQKQMSNILQRHSESTDMMKKSINDQMQHMISSEEKWKLSIVQTEAKLEIARKKCQQLARTKHYLCDFLVDAIVQAERCKQGDRTSLSMKHLSDTFESGRRRTSLYSFEELSSFTVESMNLDDFKNIFALFLAKIKPDKKEFET